MLLVRKYAQRSIIRKLTKYPMQWCTSLFSIPQVLGLISPGRITKVTDIFVVYLGPV